MRPTKPRATIGLPVYNGASFLEDALKSLLVQTYPDFELIISDNASTDRTEALCRDYAATDRRIRYYRNEANLGAAWNYNRLFQLSRGEYFKWAAADDLCSSELLRRTVDVLDHNPDVVLCYSKSKIIDEQGNVVRDYPDGPNLLSDRACERFVQLHSSSAKWHTIPGVIRSTALAKTRLIGNYVGSDTCLAMELCLHGKFVQIPEYLFFRRAHRDNAHMRRDTSAWLEFFDPRRRSRIVLPRWKLLIENANLIQRAPITAREKAYLLAYLARGVAYTELRGDRGYLTELKMAFKPLFVAQQSPTLLLRRKTSAR